VLVVYVIGGYISNSIDKVQFVLDLGDWL